MIENTSRRDPFVHIVNASNGLRGYDETENYILGMEAAGQAQFVGDCGEGITEMPTAGPWNELEALGFVRREPIPGDDLFVKAILPVGWKKVATDHSMHSKIVDERGVERVSIFYKAAFYDRRADFHIVNVGYKLANNDVWGDHAIALPGAWPMLTDTEKQDYRAALESSHRDRIAAQRHYTGDLLVEQQEQITRIGAFLALVG